MFKIIFLLVSLADPSQVSIAFGTHEFATLPECQAQATIDAEKLARERLAKVSGGCAPAAKVDEIAAEAFAASKNTI